ncbi:hypothetical protein F4820DRAFT_424306 [Hypoxylon rubiginosum]|uniref:Uncharacterized protein n=1 Tax=Hypoxylon rubiginosum TaxID=110542 RepID=A0ACB9YXU9_9PEZI|nr:hypothetical protein F4820DRAFT_424306 [Hypoxylon rubiginosum]
MPSILFVHDIARDTEEQWLVKGENSKLWPCDILQTEVPRARILLYQYDAGDLDSMAEILSSEDLVQQAEILIGMLNRTAQPIIFVGYGYGGLICEQVRFTFESFSEKLSLKTYYRLRCSSITSTGA